MKVKRNLYIKNNATSLFMIWIEFCDKFNLAPFQFKNLQFHIYIYILSKCRWGGFLENFWGST